MYGSAGYDSLINDYFRLQNRQADESLNMGQQAQQKGLSNLRTLASSAGIPLGYGYGSLPGGGQLGGTKQLLRLAQAQSALVPQMAGGGGGSGLSSLLRTPEERERDRLNNQMLKFQIDEERERDRLNNQMLKFQIDNAQQQQRWAQQDRWQANQARIDARSQSARDRMAQAAAQSRAQQPKLGVVGIGRGFSGAKADPLPFSQVGNGAQVYQRMQADKARGLAMEEQSLKNQLLRNMAYPSGGAKAGSGQLGGQPAMQAANQANQQQAAKAVSSLPLFQISSPGVSSSPGTSALNAANDYARIRAEYNPSKDGGGTAMQPGQSGSQSISWTPTKPLAQEGIKGLGRQRSGSAPGAR